MSAATNSLQMLREDVRVIRAQMEIIISHEKQMRELHEKAEEDLEMLRMRMQAAERQFNYITEKEDKA